MRSSLCGCVVLCGLLPGVCRLRALLSVRGIRPSFEASTCPCGFANIKDLRLIRCSLGGLCPSVSPWFFLHGALSGLIPLYPAAFGLSGKGFPGSRLCGYPFLPGISHVPVYSRCFPHSRLSILSRAVDIHDYSALEFCSIREGG
jgi:hypothetical protein